MKVYSLSIHAHYKCRHSGACCTAGWDIPVELPVYRNLSEALHVGRIQSVATADDSPFVTGPGLPADAVAMLARTGGGDCVFFHRGSALCVVHRDLGAPALPSTCRHFPRIAVRDWRGTFITLSHFCPTAASLLFRDDVPLEILESPPAFPPANYEGLNVSADAWPPLLHPTMLMDLEGYSAWERHMVQRCAGVERAPESVIATLRRDARRVREWKPAEGSQAGVVASLPFGFVDAAAPMTLDESLRLYTEVIDAVPDELKPSPDEAGLDLAYINGVCPAWAACHAPINRFLASKAFASWTAYQGRGVLSIVRGLEAALALVRVEAARECRNASRVLDLRLLREAIRSADFFLNHLAVGEELAERWSQVEVRS